ACARCAKHALPPGAGRALDDLLPVLEAQGGFVAVRQEGSFAVVVSVNSLPVGYRLELGSAASSEPQTLLLDAPSATRVGDDEPDSRMSLLPDDRFEQLVEQALKGLSDYTRLGRSELVVRLGLPPAPQIEQAKRLRKLLTEAIDDLRPAGAAPTSLVPRDWH